MKQLILSMRRLWDYNSRSIVITKARGWVLVGIILSVFLGLGFMAYDNINSAILNAEARKLSYDAILDLDAAVQVVVDAQGAQRGYIITGQGAYLDEYDGAETKMVRLLKNLSTTQAFMTPRLARLRRLCIELFAEMNHTIDVRKESADKASDLVQDQRGRRYMNDIKSEANELRERERGRINRLTELTQSGANTIVWLLPVAGGLGFVVITITIWIIHNSQSLQQVAWREKEEAWEIQRQTNNSLDQARQQFRRLVESVHDYAIFLLDPDGIVCTWNSGAQQIKQYAPNEIIGKSFKEFYTPEQIVSGDPQHALDTARTVGQFYTENWRVKKDGTQFWASVTIVAIKDEDNNVANFMKIERDLSVKRENELKILRAEAFFRTTIDLAPNAVIIGNSDGTIKVWNTQATQTFGYSQEDVVGKPITMLMPDRYRDDHKHSLQRATSTGRAPLAKHPLELVGLRKDGSEFPLELTFDALTMDGEINYIAILRDISERRRSEHALRGLNQQLKNLNTELVRSNAELDQFAAVASHDLKSPLRQVVSYVQLIDRRYKNTIDEEGRQYIAYAVEGATRMQALINDLLTFSRAGSGEFKPKQVDLNRVIELAIRNLNGWLADNHAEIHRPDDLPMVWGDEGSLVQVFQNLINNGVKFSRTGVHPEIWISASSYGQGWQIIVRDNGIGMEPEHMDQIWIMFKRLNGAEYAGTGIGLSIVKKVVERHGGNIGVEAKPGQGSTFFITLPAVPK